MRQFLTGLFLGIAFMYISYHKDEIVLEATSWFAHASHDAEADARIQKMTAQRR
jgi:hypothetical protein